MRHSGSGALIADTIVNRLPAVLFKAGLLTPGSPYSLHLPIRFRSNSGVSTDFVTGYSGGTVPEFHGIPY
jgi:hypothetical protein